MNVLLMIVLILLVVVLAGVINLHWELSWLSDNFFKLIQKQEGTKKPDEVIQFVGDTCRVVLPQREIIDLKSLCKDVKALQDSVSDLRFRVIHVETPKKTSKIRKK